MWRRQFIVLAVLGAMALPVGVLDQWLFAPGSVDTHFLDFRGLLLDLYLIWLLIQAVVTSAAVALWKPKRLAVVHLAGAVVSVALFVGGLVLSDFLDERAQKAAFENSERELLVRSKAVALERWSYDDTPEPEQLSVEVVIAESGDFALHATGLTTEQSVVREGVAARQPVVAGQRLNLRIPLTREGRGLPASWQIQLRFFHPPARAPHAAPSEWEEVRVLYQAAKPQPPYYGVQVERVLPPPSPR